MSTILDQSFSVGKESTYGTAVALTRAFEVQADNWKIQIEDIPSVGFRPGMQGPGSDRRKTIIMGAGGTTTFDVLNKGFGLLLQAMYGGVSGPTQQGGTAAYLSTHTTATAAPGDYYTAQFQRVDSSDTIRAFTYPGATITQHKWAHQVGGLLNVELTWDAQTGVTSEAAGSAVSPTSAATFDWTMLNVTVNSVEFCVSEIEVTTDLGLKTDRRMMCATEAGLKRAPKRAAVPQVTGTIKGEFEDLTQYNLFTAGTIVPIVLTWTGANIESSYDFEIVMTMPACKYTGDTPVASLTDMTMIDLPFVALYDQSNPMVTVTYQSTDTTL